MKTNAHKYSLPSWPALLLTAGILTGQGCAPTKAADSGPEIPDSGSVDMSKAPAIPFSPPILIDSTPGIYGLTTADWNGDGFADLAVGYNSLGPRGFNVFLGDGKGGFEAPKHSFHLSVYELESADCNLDGKLDLCAGDYITLGDGMGFFTMPAASPHCSDACPRSDVNGV